jgi:septation ring formation regulator EzrA
LVRILNQEFYNERKSERLKDKFYKITKDLLDTMHTYADLARKVGRSTDGLVNN